MNAASKIEFNTPTAGFDQPIEMWLGCHRRIERMNALLQRLVDHLKNQAVDRHAGVTAESIRRYFDEAGPRHHEDEEVDLFPRLMDRLSAQDAAGGAPGAERIAAAIATLRADHADMAQLWQALREQLLQVEAGKDPHFDDAQLMLFVTRYRAHIEIEDSVLAPAFKRAFKAKDLREIGRAMAARRGVDWDAIVAATKR